MYEQENMKEAKILEMINEASKIEHVEVKQAEQAGTNERLEQTISELQAQPAP